MKYKLKNRKIVVNMFVVLILVVSIVLAASSSFYMKKMDDGVKQNSANVIKADKNIVRSPKIDEYIKNIETQDLVEEVDIKKEITSILTTEDNKYQSHIFNYETGEEINIEDLIKEDKK